MKLSGKQKKFIKHNKKKLSSIEMATILHLDEKEVRGYMGDAPAADERNKKGKSPFTIKEFLKKKWPLILILVFLAFTPYVNSLSNGFVSDDLGLPQLINPSAPQFILSPSFSLMASFVHSLAFTIGGTMPIFYRLSTVFFHIGTVVAVYVLVTLLADDFIGFITASFFAVHPILIESVAWISGAQYAQLGFFCMWALIAYIMFQQTKKNIYIILSITLCLLSLLSSEKAVVFPFILLLYELVFGDIKKNWKYVLVYFFLIALPLLYLTNQIGVRTNALTRLDYQQRTFMNPFQQIPIAITSYLQLIFWPDKLTLYHSEMSFTMSEYLIRLIVFIAFSLLALYGLIKRKTYSFWLCFFVICLAPTLTPFGISWIVAERYVYLGSLGIIFFIGYGVSHLMRGEKTKIIGSTLFIIVLIGFFVRTIVRNTDWKNEDSLWIATGKTSPSDPKTHNNLGDVYGRNGDLERSAKEFETAIKLQTNYADAYHNLGNVLTQMGKKQEAIQRYEQAIHYNPQLWQSYKNLAVIYFNQKQFNMAEKWLSKSVEINPESSELHLDLGIIYEQNGKLPLAKQQFLEVIKRDPENKGALQELQKLSGVK